MRITNKEKLKSHFSEMKESLEILRDYIKHQNHFLEKEKSLLQEDLNKKLKEIEERNAKISKKPLDIDAIVRITNIEREIEKNNEILGNLLGDGFTFEDDDVRKLTIANSNLIQEKELLQGDATLLEQVNEINLNNEFISYFEGTFPDIQNKSNLILLFSVFERELKNLCLFLKKEFNIPIELNDLQGDDLVKCKVFLTKLCRIRKYIFEEKLWIELDTTRKLRNIVVHKSNDIGGILREKHSESPMIIREFEKISGFEIIPNANKVAFFILTTHFLEYFLNNIQEFYEKIEKEFSYIYNISQN